MVAFFVVLGIVVLASLIVLSAAVVAGRADDRAGSGLSGASGTAVRSPRARRDCRPTGPTPGSVNLIRVENDERHNPPE